MGNIIFEPVALALTVVYPAYRSYKCLEHADKYDSKFQRAIYCFLCS